MFRGFFCLSEGNEMKIIGMAETQKFEITSGKMLVTDPCYDKKEEDLKYQAKLPAKNGTWLATAEYADGNEWGVRVSRIIAWHESNLAGALSVCNKMYDADIGVDSGQAGFFDYEKYPVYPRDEINENSFYMPVCELTLSDKNFGTVDFGAVSASGYGDGGYDLYVKINDFGEVIAVWIEFIAEANPEDDLYDPE